MYQDVIGSLDSNDADLKPGLSGFVTVAFTADVRFGTEVTLAWPKAESIQMSRTEQCCFLCMRQT